MVKIDLITGFLGSGKTTFIKKYADYLIRQGCNIGILENDYGAINVDMMLLQELEGKHCELEMVSGGCCQDSDAHRRRFKTKLISMGMCGYDRILVEPSGVFDMDDFLIPCRRSHWISGMRLEACLRSWMRVWRISFHRRRIMCWLLRLLRQAVS